MLNTNKYVDYLAETAYMALSAAGSPEGTTLEFLAQIAEFVSYTNDVHEAIAQVQELVDVWSDELKQEADAV